MNIIWIQIGCTCTIQTCPGRQGSISFRTPMMWRVVVAPCEDPWNIKITKIKQKSETPCSKSEILFNQLDPFILGDHGTDSQDRRKKSGTNKTLQEQ